MYTKIMCISFRLYCARKILQAMPRSYPCIIFNFHRRLLTWIICWFNIQVRQTQTYLYKYDSHEYSEIDLHNTYVSFARWTGEEHFITYSTLKSGFMSFNLNTSTGALLLTWFNCNPSMDKRPHAQQSEGWNYLSIPKLQRCNFIPHFIMDVITYPC